jgi:hypothetical protein
MEVKKRGFRYEASWARKKECKAIVERVWRVKETQGDHWGNLKKKLHHCQHELIRWHKSNSSPMEKLIKHKTQQLVDLQGEDGELAMGEINGIQSDLHSLMEQEDLQWRQQAKANWLKHGDRNTKYLHAYANQRKMAN